MGLYRGRVEGLGVRVLGFSEFGLRVEGLGFEV